MNLGAGNHTFECATVFNLLGVINVFSAFLDGSTGIDTYINNSPLGAALNARTTRLRIEP